MNTNSPDLIDDLRQQLKRGVHDVFATMLQMSTQPAAVTTEFPAGQPMVASSVGFTGDLNGVVYLHVTAEFARTLTGRLLGMAPAELDGEEMVNDAIGELTNMVVGAVKSNVCDAGASCVMTIPSIVRGKDLSIEPISSADRRLLSFRCGTDNFFVELLMKHPR